MIITCPECARRYLIDEKTIKTEKTQVRCAVCGYSWEQTFARSDVPPSVAKEPYAPLSEESGWTPRSHEGRVDPFAEPESRGFSGGWVLFIVIFASIIGIAVFARETLVNLWPPLSCMYEVFGVATVPKNTSLRLQNIDAHYVKQGEQAKFVVTGIIANVSGQVVNIPPLRVTIKSPCKDGKSSCTAEQLKFEVSENRLLAGEQVHFETPGMKVPAIGSQVVVEF